MTRKYSKSGNVITVFDTTLRDGTQSSDVNLNGRDKLKLVHVLDEFGVDYIELGWPASNDKEKEVFADAATLKLKHSLIVAFGSTKRPDLNAEDDPNLQAIIDANVTVACIFGKTWIDHVKKQLNVTPEQNVAIIKDSVSFLKKNKLTVIYDLEHFFDGFKDNKKYALSCLNTAAKAGADIVVMCDTNGGTLPSEIGMITKEVKLFMKKNKLFAELGIHCHDDSGTGVANSLEAIAEGCTHVQGTMNGLGERCGNANLCSILPDLQLKMNKKFRKIDLKKLTHVSRIVYTLSNKRPNVHQAFVGKDAFAHKGGIHVDAVMKGASYEHIDPEVVGNKREIVLSDLSGRANIVEIAKKFDVSIDKKDPRTFAMLKDVEEMEKKGYDLGSLKAEQYLLLQKHFGNTNRFFSLSTWKVTSEDRDGEHSECVLLGKLNGKNQQVSAMVNGGPVDAMFKSLQKMIATAYKEIDQVKLVNYKVMIAQDKGAESSVRVYIEFKNNGEEWGCVGVSPNILEASLEAMQKGFRYFLLRQIKGSG